MAGHNDSSTSNKKSSDDIDMPVSSAENLQSNMKVIYYSRTFMSIIGGVAAGLLGFTGLTGFIVYLIVMAITSVGLMAKTGFSVYSYFESLNQIIMDGFLGGLMSFVLFWTVLMISCIYSEGLLQGVWRLEGSVAVICSMFFQEVVSLYVWSYEVV